MKPGANALGSAVEILVLNVFRSAGRQRVPVTLAMVERRLDELRFARQVGQGPRDHVDDTMADFESARARPVPQAVVPKRYVECATQSPNRGGQSLERVGGCLCIASTMAMNSGLARVYSTSLSQ